MRHLLDPKRLADLDAAGAQEPFELGSVIRALRGQTAAVADAEVEALGRRLSAQLAAPTAVGAGGIAFGLGAKWMASLLLVCAVGLYAMVRLRRSPSCMLRRPQLRRDRLRRKSRRRSSSRLAASERMQMCASRQPWASRPTQSSRCSSKRRPHSIAIPPPRSRSPSNTPSCIRAACSLKSARSSRSKRCSSCGNGLPRFHVPRTSRSATPIRLTRAACVPCSSARNP